MASDVAGEVNATTTTPNRLKEAFYRWCENTITTFQKHPLLAAVGTLLGLAATIATVVSATQLVWSYEIMREERIERAWDRLLQQLPGNSGKGKALTVLIEEGENIGAIDISCRAIGAWQQGQEEAQEHCAAPAVFSSFTLSSEPGERHEVRAAHRLGISDTTLVPYFSDQLIEGADFTGVLPPWDWARNTRFVNVNFYGARIDWDFGPRLWIVSSDLTNATINSISLEHLDGNNISNSIIYSLEPDIDIPESNVRKRAILESLPEESTTKNWFWGDQAPIIILNFDSSPSLIDMDKFKKIVGEHFDVCDPIRRLPLTRAHQGYDSTMPELGELIPNSIENSKVMQYLRSRSLGKPVASEYYATSSKQCRTMSIAQALELYGKSYDTRREAELSALKRLRGAIRAHN